MFALNSFVACLLGCLSVNAIALPNCKSIEARALKSAAQIPGHASGYKVVGQERLQFFSAPEATCTLPGVFILPGENVNAYFIGSGYMLVMYLNSTTGAEANSWVRAERLESNGFGIAPKQ